MKTEADVKLVTVATYGPTGSSARVRVHDWVDYLGLDAVHYGYLGGGDNSVSTVVRNIDRVVRAEFELGRLKDSISDSTVLMSREASPFSNGKLEGQLLSNAKHGVYDFDDALFDAPRGNIKALWSKSKVWLAAMDAADTVIAGNDYLGERAAQYRSDVVVIPSCVNPENYIPKSDYAMEDVPTLIWMGSPATESYLMQVARPLLNINAERKIRLKVISAGSRSFGELDHIVERVSWNRQTFGSTLAGGDFGIMPLDDSLYARGKCAYKLLQYGAAGLPVVGTPIGANKTVLNAMGGHCATTEQEWEQIVRDLLHSGDAERAALGERARRIVSSDYSFTRWSAAWRAATTR